MTAEFKIDISVKDNSKIAPAWDLQSDLNGKITLQDFVTHFRNGHIIIARETLKDEQGRGFDQDPRVRTDSRFGKPDYKVKPFGRIQYFARVIAIEAFLAVYQKLTALSPIDTGQYTSSNYVFYNNRLVARNYGEFVAWAKFIKSKGFKDSDQIKFVNVMPYAARLEQKGVTRSKRGFTVRNPATRKSRDERKRRSGIKVSRPNGVYYKTFLFTRRVFRGIGTIKFGYNPNGYGGLTILPSPPFRTSYKKTGLPYVYPTITISLSDQGIIP